MGKKRDLAECLTQKLKAGDIPLDISEFFLQTCYTSFPFQKNTLPKNQKNHLSTVLTVHLFCAADMAARVSVCQPSVSAEMHFVIRVSRRMRETPSGATRSANAAQPV